MINLKEYDLFDVENVTLKETSFDDENDVYMTESNINVINFDDVIDEYEKLNFFIRDSISSVDAILITSDKIVFIEFKNGNMQNEKRKVKEKVRDTIIVFGDITNTTVKFTREHAEFILVYNESKNNMNTSSKEQQLKEQKKLESKRYHISKSMDSFTNIIFQRADEELIRFGLYKFSKMYFSAIHTYTEKQFEKYLDSLCMSVPITN